MKHLLISFFLLSTFLTSCEEGPFSLPDGIEYIEESTNIKKNGQGLWSYYDGRTYEGEFKDGKLNGKGTMTLKNGNKYVGEYKDGETWEGTEYDKDENIIGEWVNGEKIEKLTSKTNQ
jgi:hypothetical protein|tara:strand:+ start:67 stop:420 length:354 start_codon:yes stop_codon:yes gene_type:complete